MSTAPPTVPPRPARAAQAAAAQGVSKLPDIPPRPASKRVERSISPGHYPRSPLNEPYLVKTRSRDPIPRPPSVHHLPTPGEEGMEYANVNYEPQQSSALALDAAAQTRTIGEDLHLHAPKPSLPVSSATAQVQNVTRTDSAQAAEHGVGRNSTDDLSRTKSRTGYSRPPSAASATDRRRSAVYAEDDAHASIGIRVPINPLLGDVQAPTPSGLSPQVTGEAQRKHGRRRSLMDHQLPADTYGLHGHGVPTSDKFEREWYAKHPDQLEHEEGHGHGVYEGIGSGRGSFALSSEQLNRLVRDTASRGSGFATSEKINSYPDEQIGYMASEEYQRSQQNTPLPESQTTNPLSRVQTHEPPVVSPLRRTSFPAEDAQSPEVRRSKQSLPSSEVGDAAVHIDSPKRRYNKVTGGQESMNETEEAKPYAAHGLDYGHEYRVPILAEDEVAKEIGGEHMNPAVSPVMARRGSGQYDDHNDSGAATPHSRPASRPNSVYQMHSASHSLSRFLSHQDERDHMHTPLDDVAEYEPLFDDDGKPETQADRFRKRPDAQKRFPSQDIWEDTPSSAMYVTEVSTPDLPAQLQGQNDRVPASSVFEPPEAEHARKGEVSEAEKKKLIPAEERLKMSAIAPHMKNEVSGRPGLSNRFPSQDIWEDTPDSNYLTTTVGDEQDYRDEEDETSPVDTKQPEIPTRPAKSRLGDGASSAQIAPSVAPSIPARPPKRQHMVPPAGAQLTEPITLSRETSPTELKKAPSIPDRPKPQVPPRPARKPADDELHKTLSAGSDEAPTTRAKPQVPARPMGGNIAALKGNFMSDLNKKLGLGPPKEKEPEPEPAQPKQLEDARKGRARGPQRRAPAKSPSGAAQSTPPTLKFSMFVPKSLWSIDEDGSLSMTKKSEALAANKTEVVDHAPGAAGSAPIQSEAAPEPTTTTSATETVEPRIAASKAAAPEALVEQTPGAFPDEDEDPERDLTRKTTATSYTGSDIEREDSPPATHVLPASRMTTASDESAPEAASKADDNTLIREPTRESTNERIAEDEPPKLHSEQVNAPAPGPDAIAEKHSSVSGSAPVNPEVTASGQGEGLSVEGKATEPMNEEDVKYSKLEEMTAVADGKAHAEEEPEAVNTGRS